MTLIMQKILIIEDEKGISEFLTEGLSEENYVVDTAFDGLSGLQKATQNVYDIILLDWMLPGLQGIEVTKKLRNAGIQTPIIFLTAKDTVQDTIMGLRSGANDYLKKPFSFEELLERIKVQLRKTTVEEPVILEHKAIKIDLQKRECAVNNIKLHLTQKEYDLLVFLCQNKNKVCTRDDILNKVWNIHFEYDSGVIDVYINSLRKKIKAANHQNVIDTVRGVGYIVKD